MKEDAEEGCGSGRRKKKVEKQGVKMLMKAEIG
jgi:hypothetical protein